VKCNETSPLSALGTVITTIQNQNTLGTCLKTLQKLTCNIFASLDKCINTLLGDYFPPLSEVNFTPHHPLKIS